MDYFVQHGDEKLGPFSLSALHEQVMAGKISPTDLAQSEGMTDWVGVSAVLGNVPIPAATQSAPAPVPQIQTVPLPVNMHWGILLVLQLLTRNLFNFAWAIYLANWARKLDGENKTLVMVTMYPAGMIAGIIAVASRQLAIGGLLFIAGVITYIIGIFGIKAAMESYYNSVERYGLSLSGGMTFFFSTVYFQYHINQIAKWKKAVALT
jgi:hypothetical protein